MLLKEQFILGQNALQKDQLWLQVSVHAAQDVQNTLTNFNKILKNKKDSLVSECECKTKQIETEAAQKIEELENQENFNQNTITESQVELAKRTYQEFEAKMEQLNLKKARIEEKLRQKFPLKKPVIIANSFVKEF